MTKPISWSWPSWGKRPCSSATPTLFLIVSEKLHCLTWIQGPGRQQSPDPGGARVGGKKVQWRKGQGRIYRALARESLHLVLRLEYILVSSDLRPQSLSSCRLSCAGVHFLSKKRLTHPKSVFIVDMESFGTELVRTSTSGQEHKIMPGSLYHQ